jgi:hypothetical protein
MPTIRERIGALAKRLLELENDIYLRLWDDRAKRDEATTDLDALLHEAEAASVVLDKKLNEAAREEEAQRAQAEWDETERGLRTFGFSVK